ncbi:unnamed protein product [Lactuca saligna]|uniref:Uncharacterized protein n=1 Tax=Lactuca saligna TaxID=75948 RepID=A0AA35VIL7_LACSI|nr:unnamed protein product [Lactuca saligna]
MSENSKCLAENVEGFQQCVKEIHNQIEQDENFFKIIAEFYDSKKLNMEKLVSELSRMHGALADQTVDLIKEVSKNTLKITTPIKTQHVDSSTSTSTQVTQMIKTPEFMTPVGYDFILDTSGGGFQISTREGTESSFTLSSNSNQSESFMSINKNLNPPVKNDESKAKEIKVHDPEPEALLKKISTLEKEQFSLKKKIQYLRDENALLEAEKANMDELKHMVSESNRKIETTGKVLEVYRKQLLTADDETTKLKEELARKVVYQTQLVKKLESIEEVISMLTGKLDAQEARERKLHEQVKLSLAGISKRDDVIKELSTQIDLLKNSHATEEDKWNPAIEMLKTELKEKCELVDDLNKKHDALKICTDELKLKLKGVELDSEREVTSEDAV